MKKIFKSFLYTALAFVSIVSLAACSDDDDYTPGAPAGENNVTFSSYSNVVISKTASSFDIELNRHSMVGQQTVPLETVNIPDGWKVPENASFADGDSLTKITVTVPADMKMNTAYDFIIRVPEAYTNPYKANMGQVNTFKTTVTKEDYQLYATGTYDEEFFFGVTWPVTIEYSPSLDIYRVKNMFAGAEGYSGSYDFFFKWNGKSDATQEFTLVTSTGEEASKVPTGFTYSDYGMVSVAWAAATNDYSKAADDNLFGGYVESEKTFYLPFSHSVSAGAFGDGTDYIRNVTLK